MSLWQDFMTNSGKPVGKWVHYFPVYEKHFSTWKNRSLTFLEIGVAQGGSLQMWQRYFGSRAIIIGIDISPECKKHESPGIYIRTGDQSDHGFLQELVDEFGVPDIVLDDGSHYMDHMFSTFSFFYPRMHKNAIYMLEDVHTAYHKHHLHGGGLDSPDSFVNIAKTFVDKLNADHTLGQVQPDVITRETFCISFYDSMICFEKGNVWWKQHMVTGHE